MFADGSVQRRTSTADDQGARVSAAHGRQSLLLRTVQLVLHSALGDRSRRQGHGSPSSRRRRCRLRRGGGRRRSARSRAQLDRVPVVLVLSAEAGRVDHGRPELSPPTSELSTTTSPDHQGVRVRRPYPRLIDSTLNDMSRHVTACDGTLTHPP